VEELSVALENLQVYNNALHKEVHVLYDQLHPNVPQVVAAMGAGAAGAAREEDLMGSWISLKPLLLWTSWMIVLPKLAVEWEQTRMKRTRLV
jgi:hypothetical protein